MGCKCTWNPQNKGGTKYKFIKNIKKERMTNPIKCICHINFHNHTFVLVFSFRVNGFLDHYDFIHDMTFFNKTSLVVRFILGIIFFNMFSMILVSIL
jgi:hypothetical protein